MILFSNIMMQNQMLFNDVIYTSVLQAIISKKPRKASHKHELHGHARKLHVTFMFTLNSI